MPCGDHAFFCSEFVARVLQLGGIGICDKSANLMMPRDISSAKELEFIYSGPLDDYLFLFQSTPSLEAVEQYLKTI